MISETPDSRRTVAIACQGGGSHAAFTAGVLMGLFGSEKFHSRHRLVALSGTSGGAVCAALAWSGLHREEKRESSDEAVGDGPYHAAIEALEAFWDELSAHEPVDAIVNLWGQIILHWPVTLEVSPYTVAPEAERRLRELLTKHLRLEELSSEAHRHCPPILHIGATDVLTGEGLAITGKSVEINDIVASAAVPPLYRAVKTRGHLCWDGLYSLRNPRRPSNSLGPRKGQPAGFQSGHHAPP